MQEELLINKSVDSSGLEEKPPGASKMAKVYQVIDVKKYRHESDRDLWYVLFEHERERGYTWQPTSVLGVIPNELRHKMLIMRRRLKVAARVSNAMRLVS
ncbi:uncharacterized protein EMH_0026690 [Eimeria mitis]|uniref:Uncharacterized protein n=1 Tax=Eimeria mitis TaxID=44415 RepID=U6JXP8_9EIME|nr:uncharacterized protein EMH_0026690 [Eimeria mitis]CDJ30199.1 hypothetical protein, conserved [Eimeria mitis]